MNIYAKGLGTSKKGPGSWAFLVDADGKIINESSGFVELETNNGLDIKAILKGLLWAKENGYSDFTIYTTSKYAKSAVVHWHKDSVFVAHEDTLRKAHYLLKPLNAWVSYIPEEHSVFMRRAKVLCELSNKENK